MKRTAILMAIICLCHRSEAQLTFQKSFGGAAVDYGSSVIETADKNYIVVGTTGNFGLGDNDVYVIKMDENGDVIWKNAYGDADGDYGYSVIETNDGEYIVVGSTWSFGVIVSDVYLIKINPQGNVTWSKTIGGASVDAGLCVKQTSDSGYIIAGTTLSFGAGYFDVYLVKTNSTGDVLWTKTFGGDTTDGGYSVINTLDNGYVIVGCTKSFGAGNYDMYVIKTDSNGDTLWTRTFGGIEEDWASDVIQNNDGDYLIVGHTASFGVVFTDVYLIKIDNNGDTLWTKTYAGGYKDDIGYSIQQTSDGGYIITGKASAVNSPNLWSVYLLKTDKDGNVLWSKTYDGIYVEGYGTSVYQTSDNGYIITGQTGVGALWIEDLILVKTDSLGNSGCNQTDAITITGSTSTLIGSGAIVGSGGGSNTVATLTSITQVVDSVYCITLDIENPHNSNEEIVIYPNPTTSTFTISGSYELPAVIELYDITGRLIHQYSIFNNQSTIDVSYLAKGLYVYVVKGEGESEIGRGKLVIE